jgi:hypothetical protein
MNRCHYQLEYATQHIHMLFNFKDNIKLSWEGFWVQAPVFKEIFFFLTYKWAKYARLFIPGKPFQLSIMYADKARNIT